jgi:hypothetical protein
MLVTIVQAAIRVREIDDKINVLMLLVDLFFLELLSFILVLCLRLQIVSQRFLGSSAG